MKRIIFVLLIVVGCWSFYNRVGQVQLGPGIMAPTVPQQENIDPPERHRLNQYAITKLAIFDIKAKVLSKKNYQFDREAGLAPTDLALGWGKMSDEHILEKIKISQSNRFYYWRVDSFPIPRQEIETHSANMHLIPANESVKKAIGKIRNGDIIEMSGSLVNVISDDGHWRWNSSLTRNDTGKGACELIWVESLYIVTP
jgi:hypothetical protein